jgi:hypothetical protein
VWVKAKRPIVSANVVWGEEDDAFGEETCVGVDEFDVGVEENDGLREEYVVSLEAHVVSLDTYVRWQAPIRPIARSIFNMTRGRRRNRSAGAHVRFSDHREGAQAIANTHALLTHVTPIT